MPYLRMQRRRLGQREPLREILLRILEPLDQTERRTGDLDSAAVMGPMACGDLRKLRSTAEANELKTKQQGARRRRPVVNPHAGRLEITSQGLLPIRRL